MLRIQAARLIDGISESCHTDAHVLVDGSTIVSIEPGADGSRVDKAKQLAYPNCTVLPGFIDVHVHLMFGTGLRSYEEVVSEDSDETMVLRGVRNCARHLAAGVTVVRDCGSRNRTALILRDAAEHGDFPSPQILASGPPITPKRGHFWWCNGEADGVEEVRDRARHILDAGADFLKIMASGGGTVGTHPELACYSVEEIRAATEEARRRGKKTTAHCLAAASISNALEGGIHQVEHINFLEADGVRRWDARVAETIVKRGVVVSPTIQTGYRELEELRSRGRRITKTERARLSAIDAKIESKLEFVRRFHELGATVVAGTDAIQQFGDYAIGLELLGQTGMAPMEVVKSATSKAAAAIGIETWAGSIQPGMQADLVVVDGDPTIDLASTHAVRAVIQRGEVVWESPPGARYPARNEPLPAAR